MAVAVLDLPLLQVIDTSSPCTQSLTPQPLYRIRRHSAIDLSLPVQETLSIQIGPMPLPY